MRIDHIFESAGCSRFLDTLDSLSSQLADKEELSETRAGVEALQSKFSAIMTNWAENPVTLDEELGQEQAQMIVADRVTEIGKSLVEIAHTLDQAVIMSKGDEQVLQPILGASMVYQDILGNLGITRMIDGCSPSCEYDPILHLAVDTRTPDDPATPPNTIGEIIRAGYQMDMSHYVIGADEKKIIFHPEVVVLQLD